MLTQTVHTVNHCKRPCDWLTLPSIKTLLEASAGFKHPNSLTPCLFRVITSPVWLKERDEEGLFLLGRDYSAGNTWRFKAGIRIRIDISWKMDAIDNYNSNRSCKKRRIFRFSPIFSLFWIKKWDAFWRVDPSLEMYAGVSWISPSWPEL